MPTLTIFANFFINDPERFLRMKDSFLSFKDICAEKWVINVRGEYKLDALFFLHDHLGDKLKAHVLEGKAGWFDDTRKMLPEITSDYILFWVEDHINMVDISKYSAIIEEMSASYSQYLRYTWWLFGQMRKRYDGIDKQSYGNIEAFEMGQKANAILQQNRPKSYIIDIPGIFTADFFKKIISKNDPALRRWPKETPFDFEKKGTDTHWLPFKTAIPKYELFASIDDDLDCPGYSLQSRGLYPKRVVREAEKAAGNSKSMAKTIIRRVVPAAVKSPIKRLSYHF